MSKINVLVIPSDRTGVGKFRSVDPHIFLQNLYPDDFHVDINPQPEYNNDNFKNVDHIMNCQKTGADLFQRNVKTKKIDKNFFPKDLLDLMEQNPKFYFGSDN